MGILGNLFNSDTKSKNIDSKFNWIGLTNKEELQDIINTSYTKPVVIFKHSTRCSISRTVLKNYESSITSKADFYCLDLLNYREISNQLSTKFNVVHQSPQVLFISNGVCVYHASHEAIIEKQTELNLLSLTT